MMEPDSARTWNGSVSSWTLKCTVRHQDVIISPWDTMCMYLFLECQDHDGSPHSLSRSKFTFHTQQSVCPITFTFALIILWTSFLHEECKWAPTERSVSSICLVLTGRSWSRAAWAVLTCHQNTVLGFSTMGPGHARVWLAPARAPGAAHWALRGHNRWITCQCLSFSVFNQRGYLWHV